MKRPIVIPWLACLLGVILVLNLGYALKHIIFISIIISIIFIILFIHNNNYGLLFVCFISFFLISSINTFSLVKQSKYLDCFKNEKYSEIKGTVIQEYKDADKYIIKTEYIKQEGSIVEVSQRIMAYINRKTAVKAGDTVKIKGILEDFESPGNPGGFMSKNYYLTKKIYSKTNTENIAVEKTRRQDLFIISSFFREQQLQKLYRIFPKQQAEIMGKMLLGINIENESKDLYKIAGISHVLAISGMHISILAALLLFVFKRVFPSQKAAVTFVIILLIIYVLFTGAAASAVRAAFMYIVFLSTVYINENYDGISALLFSNTVLLMYNPFLVYDIGFLLSYSAAGGIIVLNPLLKKIIEQKVFSNNAAFKSLSSSFSITIAASIATLPVLLVFFYKIPTYGLLVNLLIVPVISIVFCFSVIALLVINISLKSAFFISGISFYSLSYIELCCKIAEALPFSYIVTGRPPSTVIWGMIIALFAKINQERLIISLAKYFKPIVIRKNINIFILITIIMAISSASIERIIHWEELKITFLDVGQGDAAVIGHRDEIILIDGGGNKKNDFYKQENQGSAFDTSKNTGEYVLLPFLEIQGISKIDTVFISHSDFDHICGIIEIIDKIKIKKIFISATYKNNRDPLLEILIKKAADNKVIIDYFSKGDNYSLGNLSINCIYPDKSEIFQECNNNNSLVLHLNFKKFDILFTGDIEEEKERLINIENDFQIEIMKVPHHGSKTSSSITFVEKFKPSIAIFSYGKDNKFGHPNKDIVDRYKNINAASYHTPAEGAITVKTNGKSYTIETFITERRDKFLCKN